MGVKAVMCGCLLENDDHKQQILKSFKTEFGEEIQVLGSYKTLPGDGGEGGRSDIVIELPDGILNKAAVHPWHLNGLFRWADDFLSHSRHLVPEEAITRLFDGVSPDIHSSGITRDEFQSYEDVRKSGVTNMYAVILVGEMSGLSEQRVKDVMKHYGELMTFYPGVRK